MIGWRIFELAWRRLKTARDFLFDIHHARCRTTCLPPARRRVWPQPEGVRLAGLSRRAVVFAVGRALGSHYRKIPDQYEVKPHKVRYYLERRDADFETKMAEALCVYREVALFEGSR